MKCLSIRQPWAAAIVNGHKDIENRTWPTNYRGPVLIHAGLTHDLAGNYIGECMTGGQPIPQEHQCDHGGIVGIAEIVDCVTQSDSPWFEGPYGFVIANARPLPFTPLRGQLGLFEVQLEVAP